MKIDEPKTPYNYEGLDLDVDALDADTLAKKYYIILTLKVLKIK